MSCGGCPVTTGELNKQVTLQNRAIVPPIFGSADFDESFSTTATVWASIKTKAGKTIFDGVNQDVRITHEIIIRYDSTVTAETWIEFEGKKIDIVQVEDINEEHAFLRLLCNYRGAAKL